MPKVTLIQKDGREVVIANACGSLMEAATFEEVEGIDGDCGGVCSCATCHVKIPPEWREKVGPPSEQEQDILEFEDNADESSRLSCQIDLTDDLDGLTVHVGTDS